MAQQDFAQPAAPAATDWFAQYQAPPGGQVGITDPGQGPNRDGTLPTFGGAGTPGGGGRSPLIGPGWRTDGAPATGGASAAGNPTDRNYVLQQIQQKAQEMQAQGQYVNPSVFNDPGYWADRIIEHGGWVDNGPQANNIAYFSGRFGMPEGAAAAGGGGAGGGSPYGVLGGGTTPLSDLAAGQNPIFDLANQAAQGLESSPGYQFRLQQGQQALERGAAAKGTLLTGGTAKALDRYGQDFASTEYANRLNQLLGMQGTRYNQLLGEQGQRAGQLMGLSQLGMGAAGQQANLGAGYAGQAGNLLNSQATNVGDLVTGGGNAAAASTIAQGNAWAQGLNGVAGGANNALQMYYLSKLYGGGAGQTPYTGPGPAAGGYQVPGSTSLEPPASLTWP